MSAYDPWRSRLRVSGVVLPVWSYIGIVESWTEVDQIEKRRDLNGGTCVLRPLWAKKYRINLSASGNAIRWVPAFEAIDKAEVVELQSTRFMTFRIPPGAPSVTLPRKPVDESVKIWRPGDRFEAPVPFLGVVDRLVSITPSDQELVGRFRPIFHVTRNAASGTHPEIEGRVEWQTEFEEA